MRRRRRQVVIGGALALAPFRAAWAQPAYKRLRIGLLLNEVPAEAVVALLKKPLAERGYEEGLHYTLHIRSAQGHKERLDALAGELVAAQVDLIVAPLNPEIAAARRASSALPIVMMFAAAPVETGLVASLARPGGNITGTTTNAPELPGKMIEVLRDAVSGVKRLAVLFDPEFPGMGLYRHEAERAAMAMGIAAQFRAVRTSEDLTASLDRLGRDRPDALFVSMTGPMVVATSKIIAFAAQQRLPALYSTRGPVTHGGLLSYAPDFQAMARRNAAMIDRILKGARPADIPVEEPARFMLSINLKTAGALGLKIPQSLLLRADEVIE